MRVSGIPSPGEAGVPGLEAVPKAPRPGCYVLHLKRGGVWGLGRPWGGGLTQHWRRPHAVTRWLLRLWEHRKDWGGGYKHAITPSENRGEGTGGQCRGRRKTPVVWREGSSHTGRLWFPSAQGQRPPGPQAGSGPWPVGRGGRQLRGAVLTLPDPSYPSGAELPPRTLFPL